MPSEKVEKKMIFVAFSKQEKKIDKFKFRNMEKGCGKVKRTQHLYSHAFAFFHSDEFCYKY